MKKDAVNRGLKERSDMNTLVEAGIQGSCFLPAVPCSESFDRSVDSRQRRFVRAKHEERPGCLRSLGFTQLSRSLTDRPEESVLMEQGKMMGRRTGRSVSAIDQMAASLQSTEKELDMQFKKSSVEQK